MTEQSAPQTKIQNGSAIPPNGLARANRVIRWNGKQRLSPLKCAQLSGLAIKILESES